MLARQVFGVRCEALGVMYCPIAVRRYVSGVKRYVFGVSCSCSKCYVLGDRCSVPSVCALCVMCHRVIGVRCSVFGVRC